MENSCQLADRAACIGCSACAAACPVSAIGMERDENEFLYPAVEEARCIACGRCTKACPILSPMDGTAQHALGVYSGHYASEQRTLESASGGFVSALSEAVIDKNGVVYGVCYNGDFSRAVYCRAEHKADLAPMKGSKYVMSELSAQTYHSLQADLKTGRPVLFVGCPCEVYAVKKYFHDAYDNLLTCELICQGGTAPRALRLYVKETEAACGSKAVYMNMRAKRDGSANPYMMMMMASGQVVFEPLGDTDFDAAFRNLKRECCYDCRFKMPNNVGDFTAGDHIGMSEGDAVYFRAGASVIFANTEKALAWCRQLREFDLQDETFERAAGIQTCLFHSIERSMFRDQISRDLQQERLGGARQAVEQMKAHLLEDCVRQARQKLGSRPLRLAIWGVGKYFERTWDSVEKLFASSTVAAVVDKYKTGTRHGAPIIPPDRLKDAGVDHVFICSVAAQREAFETLRGCFGGDIRDRYTLVMLPSDMKNENHEEGNRK